MPRKPKSEKAGAELLAPIPADILDQIITTRAHCPNDEAATKLLWLALRNLTAKWQRTAYAWHAAMNQLAIFYGDRFTPSA